MSISFDLIDPKAGPLPSQRDYLGMNRRSEGCLIPHSNRQEASISDVHRRRTNLRHACEPKESFEETPDWISRLDRFENNEWVFVGLIPPSRADPPTA